MHFQDALRSYIAEPRNTMESEGEHYGPYMYLEVMTWPEAGFDDHASRGSLEDLARLARLSKPSSTQRLLIRLSLYARNSRSTLHMLSSSTCGKTDSTPPGPIRSYGMKSHLSR